MLRSIINRALISSFLLVDEPPIVNLTLTNNCKKRSDVSPAVQKHVSLTRDVVCGGAGPVLAVALYEDLRSLVSIASVAVLWRRKPLIGKQSVAK